MMIVWGIIKFIILISFLVIIHEGGHFLMAKAVGMKVNQFAVGFGPSIWEKQIGETLYAVRWIPLGGYVALEGEEGDSDDPRAFNNKPVWARFLVVVMGATVNIVFALTAFFIIYYSAGEYLTTIVDGFTEGSAASVSGMQVNDEVYAVNGKRMRTLSAITEYLRINKEKPVVVTVKRGNEKINYTMAPDVVETGLIGLTFVDNTAVIDEVSVDSPAEGADFKSGDKIVAINGEAFTTVEDFTLFINGHANVPVNITLLREGEEITKEVTPICPDLLKKYVMGFYGKNSDDKIGLVGYSFWESITQMQMMLNQVGEIFTGKINVKYLSGPVGIAKVVGDTSTGSDFMTLLIFISLNLGIVNLLPIPPLDGGKLVFILIEGITRKRPNPKIELYLQMAGMAMLLLLMVFVTFNDITRNMSIF